MSLNDKLLKAAAAAGGITPSEHFGVVLYEGDGAAGNSINGGKFGGAGSFDGSSSTIVIPNSIEQPLIFAKEFGVSMWFNLASLPTGSDEDFLISLYQEGYLDIRIKANGVIQGKVAEETSGTDRIVTSANSVISANTWYNVVWTGETNNLILYVNGSSVATGSTWNGTYYHSNAGCRIGSKSGPSYYFNGKIDQVRIFQKQLSSSEVSTLYAETASTVESLDPLSEDTTDTLQVLGDSSCIATYRFENNEDDLSGNYDGTGTGIQYTAGRYGQAASFTNNSDAKMQLSSKILADNDNLTISFWIKNMVCGDYGTIIGEGVDSVTAGYNVQINPDDDTIDFFRSAGGSSYVFSGNSYDFGISGSDWVHCCFTVSTTQLKYYKNGVNVLTASVSNTSSVTGNYNTSFMWDEKYERFQKGDLDQVRVFHKTLSATEVTTLYNENPLVASYRFEGNANDDMRTYDGTATNVTYEYGLGFTPDLVWVKDRGAAGYHAVHDSTRGATKGVFTNVTNGEYTGLVTSLDTGGFTVNHTKDGSDNNTTNRNGGDFVAWAWKANGGTTASGSGTNTTSVTNQVNSDAGFSITTFTGSASAAGNFTHGLGEVPDMYIVKTTSFSDSWFVWHKDLTNTTGYALRLNTNAAEQNLTGFWNDTAPTSTLISLGNGVLVNNATYVAYAFKSIDGFSSFGSYTGNGDANGPIIETGFEPAFIMVKRYNTVSNWVIYDNKRNTINPRFSYLMANTDTAETGTAGDAAPQLDFLSNGFQPSGTEGYVNANGDSYLYMAFAADPDTEAPTVANSFGIQAYAGTGSTQTVDGLGFSPSLTWIKGRTNTASHQIFDTIRGATFQISSDTTGAETQNTSMLTSFDSDGVTLGGQSSVNGSGVNYVAWNWKADDNEPTIFGGPAIAVYKFEDNANDVTGSFNATTATNITYSSSGKFNKAGVFNGSSTKVEFDGIGSLPTGSGEVSWSMWVYTDTGSQTCGLGGYGRWNSGGANSGAAQKYFGTGLSSGNLYFYGYYYNDGVSVALPTGQWNHLVYVREGSNIKIYLNNTLEGTIARGSLDIGGGTGNLDLTIGKQAWNDSAEIFDGKIDQVRIYRGALKEYQVNELYNETASQNDDLSLGGPPEILVSANANAGFSIVKYDGTGVSGTKVPHGLSATPNFVIYKRLDSTANWIVKSTLLNTDDYLALSLTDKVYSDSGVFWNGTAPTSTVFTLGNSASVNASGAEYIAYCFHDITGYQKFGTYTGIASGNVTVTTGFRPDFVMVKCTSHDSTHWELHDSVRTHGSTGAYRLRPNENSTDGQFNDTPIKYTSTGFYLDSSVSANSYADYDANGRTYIYWAIKIN